MSTTKLIIVVPCYNEEEVLKETTRQLSDILSRMEQQATITEGHLLYVDDRTTLYREPSCDGIEIGP